MRPTFEQTVDILVKAYLNGTLEHGNCFACAVGNLVAHKNGYHYTKCNNPSTGKLLALVENEGEYSGPGGRWFNFIKYGDENGGEAEIASTGYTPSECLLIEKAFEGCEGSLDKDEYMLNGLFAVVDVLAEIHNIDLTVREETKKLFVKQ